MSLNFAEDAIRLASVGMRVSSLKSETLVICSRGMVKKKKWSVRLTGLLGVALNQCGRKGVELECKAFDQRSSLTFSRELENEITN